MPACVSRLALLATLCFVTFVHAAETVVATARQADGKIVVAAVPQNPPPGESRFLVGRLLADGNVDTAFGDQGWATFGGGAAYATFLPTAIAVASTGRIVVAFQQDEFVGLAALTSTGERDTQFGGSGKLVDWDSTGYRVNAIALSEASPFFVNGQSYVIAAGGYKGPNNNNLHWDVALLRYNLSGYKDPTFGNGGAVRLPFGAFDNEARAIVVTPFSSMFLAGYTTTGLKKRNFLVARVDMNGAVESGFGSGGSLSVDYMGQDDEAYGIAFNMQITRLFVMGRAGKPEAGGVRGLFGVMGLNYDGTALTSPMLQVTDVALEEFGDADATALAYIPLQGGTYDYLIGGTARNVATGKSRMVIVRCSMGALCGNSLWGTNGHGTAVLSAPAGDSDVTGGMFLSDAHQSVVAVGTRTSGMGVSMVRGEFSTGTGYLLTDYTLAIPETTITSGPPSVSNSRLAAFTVTSDIATTFECALDTQPFAFCSSFGFEGLADGQHVFSVRAYNYAGADATPATWTWTVDATVPETTIWAKPGPYVSSNSITFQFSSNDAGATFECNVDGAGFAACSPPVVLSLPDGEHSFAVRALDAAGNVDPTPDTAVWTVDPFAPETIIFSSPPEVVNVTTVTLHFGTLGGEPATFECALDGPFVPCTSPMTYSNLSQGGHFFQVRARDLAGNVDPSPAQRYWIVDTSGPSTRITSGPSQQTSATFATFNFTSDDPVFFYQCSLNGAPFAGCTSPVAYGGLPEGVHTFVVRGIDPAGNIEANPPTMTWLVDWTAPETLITSGPPEFTNSTSATFAFSAGEAATFQCSLDDAPFAPCNGGAAASYFSLTPGMHRLEVRARDLASNLDASPSEFVWVIDLTPPTTTITSSQPSGGSTQATLTFTSNEATATFTCRVDINRNSAAPWLPCVSPVVLTGLVSGLHVFEVRAKDAAGNIDATQAGVSWTVSSGATAPLDTTITSGPVEVIASTSAGFTFTSTVANATFECRVNTSSFQPCSSPKTYSFPNGTTNTVYVRARNPQTGELDTTPASNTFVVDLSAPVTAFTNPPPNPQAPSATFSFASRPGSTFECRLDGAGFTSCVSGITHSALTAGPHQFQVRARDNTGKLGPVATRAWTVN